MKKRSSSHSNWQRVLTRLRGLFGRKPEPEPEPEDPFAGVRSPKKRGPQNRCGAVALAEPDEDEEGESLPPRIA
jgi:hypothetical protein